MKDWLRYAGWTAILTALRVLPFPCRTGLYRIGQPGRDAPDLLTGNFRLTVERVRRAARGIDAYLLVANSRGVNVWCAATGGLLTDHDVISVIKTSGIEHLVDYRDVILPQLAATGIEAKIVQQRTGWKVIWGPVHARDFPAFLRAGRTATRAMRTVRFPWTQRLEMAVAWAFPISLLALLLLPIWPSGALLAIVLARTLASAIFLGFPLYARRLVSRPSASRSALFDLGPRALLLLAWLGSLAGYAACEAALGELSAPGALRWAALSLIILSILSLDLMGSTPVPNASPAAAAKPTQ